MCVVAGRFIIESSAFLSLDKILLTMARVPPIGTLPLGRLDFFTGFTSASDAAGIIGSSEEVAEVGASAVAEVGAAAITRTATEVKTSTVG